MKNIYKIGGKIIEIKSIYKEVHDLCREYQYSGNIDFFVEITKNDIDRERKKSAFEDKRNEIPTREFPESYLEILAVYRKIAEEMLNYDTVLWHGSVVAVDRAAYLFTAKSGTGKSTHTRLWREYLGKRAIMVNDDKPLLQITDNGILAHGTPWDGKHHLSSNISVPLKAICILTRSDENYIERISCSVAYPTLLQQIYRPHDPLKMKKTLELLDRISNNIALYKMGCNMDIQAAKVAYNTMKG